MRMSLAVLCCWAVVAGSSVTASATAAEGQDLAARAAKRLHQGDRRGAIGFLEEAYEADALPDYLHQMAEQYEQLEDGDARDLRLAIALYLECLATEKNPIELQSLHEHLTRLRQKLVVADGQPVPRTRHATPPAPPPAVEMAPPPPQAVAVNFAAKSDQEQFEVTVAGRKCQTPCTLELFPGRYTLLTTGADAQKLTLEVPHAPGTVHLASSGSRYLLPGILLTVLGPIVAATFWAFENACPSSTDFVCQGLNEGIWPAVGGVAFITGIAFLGYWGSHQVSVADMQVAESDPVPALRLASVALQPMRNGAGAGVGLSF